MHLALPQTQPTKCGRPPSVFSKPPALPPREAMKAGTPLRPRRRTAAAAPPPRTTGGRRRALARTCGRRPRPSPPPPTPAATRCARPRARSHACGRRNFLAQRARAAPPARARTCAPRCARWIKRSLNPSTLLPPAAGRARAPSPHQRVGGHTPTAAQRAAARRRGGRRRGSAAGEAAANAGGDGGPPKAYEGVRVRIAFDSYFAVIPLSIVKVKCCQAAQART